MEQNKQDFTPISTDVTCPAIGYQKLSVCVPVTVTPFANTGTIQTKCCSGATVTPGKNTCEGTKNGSCVFTLSQTICVSVPVEFGAVASTGDTYVDCVDASNQDICASCGIKEP